MEKYILNNNNHFYYSPRFFTPEIIKDILDKKTPKQKLKLRENEIIPLGEILESCEINKQQYSFDGITVNKEASVKDVIDSVFNELNNDPEVGIKTLAENFEKEEGISKQDAQRKAEQHYSFATSNSYLTTADPFNLDLIDTDIEASNENHERYHEEYDGDMVSIYIGQSLVAKYDKGKFDETSASAIGDIIKWAVVVFDVFTVVCTIAGIWAPKLCDRIASKLIAIINKGKEKFAKVIPFFNKAAKESNLVKKAKAIITALSKIIKVGISIKALVKAFFQGVKWWKKLLYVASLVANILLLFVSAGASLAAKMVKLGAQLIILTRDILKALGSLSQPQKASLA